jgi:RNA polymerase sigma-70 factor, ECF subfamily
LNRLGSSDRMDADEVMRRYAGGDEAAFHELYAALSPRLYSFCVRLAGRNGDADDLFQDAFLKLHRSRATYVSGASALHWAFAIVRSTHVDRLRRRTRRPEKLVASTDEVLGAIVESAGSPESDLHAGTLARIVEQELQRMSERNRSAYILLKVEGLTAVEAAAVLGTTSDAVKQRASRAYEALREALTRAGWQQVSRA